MSNVENKVFGIMGTVLSVSEDSLSIDSSPETIETWDSLRQINLVLALEEAFGIRFGEDQMLELSSAKAIVDVVTQLMK